MMKKSQKTIRMASILALVLILAACTTPTVEVQPTQDIPAVRTEAVQTVIARLTIEAALNPTATAEPTEPEPSEAPEATATSLPTATTAPTATEPPAAPAATATTAPTARPTTASGGGTGAVFPTATRRTGPDQAQLVSQEPRDGTVFNPGAQFDGVWTFKNTGTSTWTTDYDFRFISGVNYSESGATVFSMPQEVPPGGTVRFIVDMVAPSTGGRSVSNWDIVNENGDSFAKFYVIIDVQ
jgi:hypothetical protein